MKRRTGVFVLFFSILLVSCDHSTLKIMPLGDSITEGLTVIQGVHTFNGGYRRDLETLLTAQKVDFDFVGSQTDADTAQTVHKHHEGHSGWRIEDIDAQVDGWVGSTQPDVILLLLGANDILQKHDVPGAPARFSGLLDHLRQVDPNAWIFVASILPIHDELENAQVQSYNESIGDDVAIRQSHGEKIRWVDMNRDSGLTAAYEDLPDGLHPDRPGYDKMANVWFGALKDFVGSASF